MNAPERPLRLLGVGDGRSLNFLRWARRLAERGHEVHIASDRITPRPAELGDVAAHDVRELERLTRVRGIRRFRIGPAIGNLARRLEIDVVHAHYLLPYGWWAARADRHPLVMSPWSRDIFVDAKERRQGRRRAHEAIEAADFFVVNSEANRRATIGLGGDPAVMREIIWYSELDRFGPDRADRSLRARLGWPDDALVVLSLRNFRPYTNLDVAVRAFARASREEPRARLILAARGGPTRPEIEALVDDLGIRSLVAFVRAEVEELPALVASADLAVTIASTDSTPASLLEVMASRVPVVAGRTYSIDEWIEPDGGGELVDCRDEDGVAKAILELLRNPELRRRHGERNERYVRGRLGDPPGEQLERLYTELLARPKT